MSVDKLGKPGDVIPLQSFSQDDLDKEKGLDKETQDIGKVVALEAKSDAKLERQEMKARANEMKAAEKAKMVKTASKASVFIKQAITFVKAFFATMSLSFARSHVNGFEKRDVQVFRGEQLYKKIVAASVARKNAERALSQAAKDKGEIQNESTAPLGKANASLSKAERALSKAEANFKNAEDSLKGSISALLEYECHHGNTVDNLSERLETDLGLYAGVSPKLAQEVLSEFPKLVIVKMEEKIQGIASLKSFAKVEADKVAGALREPGSEVSRDAVSSTALRDGIVTFQKNIAAKVKELKLPLTKDEVSEIQTQALISVMPTIVDRLPEISKSFEMDCKGMSGDIEKTLKASELTADLAREISRRAVRKEYRETREGLGVAQKTAQNLYLNVKKTLDDDEKTKTYNVSKKIKDATDENKTNRASIASKAAVDKRLGSSVSKDLAKEEARYGKVMEGLEKEKKDILRDYNVGLKEAENTRDTELARLDKALSAAETKKEKALEKADATLKHSLARAQTVYDKAVAELDALKTQGEANLLSLQGLLTGHDKESLIDGRIANMKSMIESYSKPIILDVEEGSLGSYDSLLSESEKGEQMRLHHEIRMQAVNFEMQVQKNIMALRKEYLVALKEQKDVSRIEMEDSISKVEQTFGCRMFGIEGSLSERVDSLQKENARMLEERQLELEALRLESAQKLENLKKDFEKKLTSLGQTVESTRFSFGSAVDAEREKSENVEDVLKRQLFEQAALLKKMKTDMGVLTLRTNLSDKEVEQKYAKAALVFSTIWRGVRSRRESADKIKANSGAWGQYTKDVIAFIEQYNKKCRTRLFTYNIPKDYIEAAKLIKTMPEVNRKWAESKGLTIPVIPKIV